MRARARVATSRKRNLMEALEQLNLAGKYVGGDVCCSVDTRAFLLTVRQLKTRRGRAHEGTPNVAAEWLVLILGTRKIPKLNIEQRTG